MYTDKVLDHFLNPRNVGDLPSPAAHARVQNKTDGDIVDIWLKVERGRVVDAKFRCTGCTAAIACASAATEWVRGKTVRVAARLTKETIAKILGGLPPQKMICSNLAPEAICRALNKKM